MQKINFPHLKEISELYGAVLTAMQHFNERDLGCSFNEYKSLYRVVVEGETPTMQDAYNAYQALVLLTCHQYGKTMTEYIQIREQSHNLFDLWKIAAKSHIVDVQKEMQLEAMAQKAKAKIVKM